MYIEDELVDSVPVLPSTDNKLRIEVLKRELLRKYSQRLKDEKLTPTFVLEGVPSRLNGEPGNSTEKFDKFKNGYPSFPPKIQHQEESTPIPNK